MPRKVPYGSLAFMYVAQHVATETCSRWLPSTPSLLVPPGADARTALRDRGYFPWAERIYETHERAIEAAYAKAKSALYLWADPERLVLAPVEVRGIEIDWDVAYPDDLDHPFSPAFAPPLKRLPKTPAPPPKEAHTLGEIIVQPRVDRARYISADHPQIVAATEALREKFLAAYPEDVRRRLKEYPRALNLEDAPPLDVLLAYLPQGGFNDRIRDVLTRRWGDIQDHVARGETAIAVLSAELPDDFLAARPDPASEKPRVFDLGHLFRAASGAALPLRDLIEDLILRGELDPSRARFALLLRRSDPFLGEKLSYLEGRYPDSPLLPELRALLARTAASPAQPTLVVDLGPETPYKLTRLPGPVTEAASWRDDLYEPPPQA